MTIHYLIAGFGAVPNGGLRIIYEQARRLAARGHKVELHHFERFGSDRLRRLPRQALGWLRVRGIRRPPWFELPADVVCNYHFGARLPLFQPGDKVIATYWKTYELIEHTKAPGVDYFYLIQGFETWIAGEHRLYRHWRDNSVNLVVSKWLERKVMAISGQATLIPNAVDFSAFGNDRPDRGVSNTILFCSMADRNKGTATVVAALERLHRSGVPVRAVSFGNVDPATLGLTLPCDHHQLPDQLAIRELYNSAAIFVSASYSEGWGLTLAEATMCGCALVVSDAEGHFEFARPGKSAFFFRRGDADALARKLAFLIARPALCARLQRNALADLAPFTWDRSIDRLEAVLSEPPAVP